MDNRIEVFRVGDKIPEGSKFLHVVHEEKFQPDPEDRYKTSKLITPLFYYEVPIKEKQK